ncbi:hypothetical protein O6H91_06G053900 [Diphasiastrum complanatum]|uniref:Uncharacterized protein n=1 Tax=Diphasiastrum complanatum TaxID=34168 RepID=A0ACC2DEK3_DIPCM|nr:hypothetical protein O6H91_06G053900 [Diphasiastrum complanatum]
MEESIGVTSESSAALRVVQLAAGEAHTLALTASGSLYAWGRGFFGRLGTGKETDELSPVPILLGNINETSASCKLNIQETSSQKREKARCVVGVAAGAYHSLSLSADGVVWSWGYNEYGQLGRKDGSGSVPGPICFHSNTNEVEYDHILSLQIDGENDIPSCPVKVVAVEAGGMMSCAIDQEGKVWMWGLCPNITHKDESDSTLLSMETPECVKGLGGYFISRVACGNEHVLALAISQPSGERLSDGAVCFSWGNNSHGQLGLGDRKNRSSPQLLDIFSKSSTGYPFDISCGAFHSCVLVASETSKHGSIACLDITAEKSFLDESHALPALVANGSSPYRSTACWTFGEGENGQLGHGTAVTSLLPVCVQGLPREEKWVSIACGLFHTAVVSETGEVWVWGMQNGLGLLPGIELSRNESGDALLPYKIFADSLSGQECSLCLRWIVCGAAHTVTLAHEGYRIFSWGRGQNGVLGSGQSLDSWIPCPVVWPPPDQLSGCENSKPLMEEEKMNQTEGFDRRSLGVDVKVNQELEIKLSLAVEEISSLKKELAFFKDSAESLQFAVYGGLKTLCEQDPEILRATDMTKGSHSSSSLFSGYGAGQKWQKTMFEANYADLLKYESFYRAMLSQVEDLILKKKVENLCQSYFRDLSVPRTSNSEHLTSHGNVSLENFLLNKEYLVSSNQESYSVEELKNLAVRLHKS